MLFYGYKNHIKADNGTKLITIYSVTIGSVHELYENETLISRDDAGQKIYAESAYVSQNESIDWCDMTTRKHPSTDEQKSSNLQKPKSRAKVEHLFGFKTTVWMPCIYIRLLFGG
jgi:transposase, IS5 family